VIEWIKTADRKINKIIDVGGGSGHVALEVAKVSTQLRPREKEAKQR
jgi:ubiquinone/menaquinone biosynthesis C-methylase UbiE